MDGAGANTRLLYQSNIHVLCIVFLLHILDILPDHLAQPIMEPPAMMSPGEDFPNITMVDDTPQETDMCVRPFSRLPNDARGSFRDSCEAGNMPRATEEVEYLLVNGEVARNLTSGINLAARSGTLPRSACFFPKVFRSIKGLLGRRQNVCHR